MLLELNVLLGENANQLKYTSMTLFLIQEGVRQSYILCT